MPKNVSLCFKMPVNDDDGHGDVSEGHCFMVTDWSRGLVIRAEM